MADTMEPASRTQAREGAASRRSARPGLIAHTELISSEPQATKAWCNNVMGWTFAEPMDFNGQPYEMWRREDDTGGGIRKTEGNESPGAMPYVEVDDVRAVLRKAIDAGAQQLSEPKQLPDDSWVASVMAPGAVPIGFWSPGGQGPSAGGPGAGPGTGAGGR